MGREGVSDRMGRGMLIVGRYSRLTGLGFSVPSLGQLALTFKELLRMSWRLRGGVKVYAIGLEEAVCKQVVRQIIDVDEK